jgi:hypothetical protein
LSVWPPWVIVAQGRAEVGNAALPGALAAAADIAPSPDINDVRPVGSDSGLAAAGTAPIRLFCGAAAPGSGSCGTATEALARGLCTAWVAPAAGVPERAEAALCNACGMPAAEAICRTTSTPGNAGLGDMAVSADAVGLNATTVANRAAALAPTRAAERILHRDMASLPQCGSNGCALEPSVLLEIHK